MFNKRNQEVPSLGVQRDCGSTDMYITFLNHFEALVRQIDVRALVRILFSTSASKSFKTPFLQFG
jgi:hypothetical protein